MKSFINVNEECEYQTTDREGNAWLVVLVINQQDRFNGGCGGLIAGTSMYSLDNDGELNHGHKDYGSGKRWLKTDIYNRSANNRSTNPALWLEFASSFFYGYDLAKDPAISAADLADKLIEKLVQNPMLIESAALYRDQYLDNADQHAGYSIDAALALACAIECSRHQVYAKSRSITVGLRVFIAEILYEFCFKQCLFFWEVGENVITYHRGIET